MNENASWGVSFRHKNQQRALGFTHPAPTRALLAVRAAVAVVAVVVTEVPVKVNEVDVA